MFLNNTVCAEYFLETRWGTLSIGIGPDGLNHILFKNCSQERIHQDEHFLGTFVNWLREFQNLDTDERWSALSPQGTDFQKTVWRALLDIPSGSAVSYGAIAGKIDRPKACRAVGSAIAANTIALLIPCHRVIPASGGTGNYRWRADRKKALLQMEKACNADFTQIFKLA